jgi:phosphatidate cytidylyltransferase
MTSKNLSKRIITSIPLIFLLTLSFYYFYILIITLIFVTLISWIEFNGLISKIFKIYLNIVFINLLSLIYLLIFSFFVTYGILQDNFKLNMIYLFLTCIFSDVGGMIFGKIFKGKKLTKISPNKTVSGSIGSFLMSLLLVPLFYFLFNEKFLNLFDLILISVFTSFFCQLGDLFISFLKRKAKVKDTGNILPGHGGLLDRLDGMLLAIPIGVMIWEFLIRLV